MNSDTMQVAPSVSRRPAVVFYHIFATAVDRRHVGFNYTGSSVADLTGRGPTEARQVGNYLIYEEIGSGGMSRVYRATRVEGGEPLAIKVIRIEDVDADYERRLRREPEVQRGIGHENIVGLIDWFRHRDEFFLVMEYVDGRSLSHIIYKESGPMPFARARGYMRQSLRALDHLHTLGIIHRDIKPSNILVRWDDMVKLADFGIAKFSWQQGQTRTQKGLGTPEYMSPEQARGGAMDHRTDIYSLGVTLFELLTGRKPFAREEDTPAAYVEVIQGVINNPLPDPRTFQPSIPTGAVRLLMKATAKNPEDRFQSAREFLGALEVVDDEDISPATVSIGDATRAMPTTPPVRQTPPPVTHAVPAQDRNYRESLEQESKGSRSTGLWIVLLLLVMAVGGYFGYEWYQKSQRAGMEGTLTDSTAVLVSQQVASDYSRYQIDQNSGALASLYDEKGVVYFSKSSASRKTIEADVKSLHNRLEFTDSFDIQVRKQTTRATSDSTIDTEWIINYRRVKSDGGILAGSTSNTLTLERINGEWLITKQRQKWARTRNQAPPDTTNEGTVRDLDPGDTAKKPTTPQTPPVDPPDTTLETPPVGPPAPVDTGDLQPKPEQARPIEATPRR